MAWWGTVQCPVVPAEQEWIEKSADFLLTSFGADRAADRTGGDRYLRSKPR